VAKSPQQVGRRHAENSTATRLLTGGEVVHETQSVFIPEHESHEAFSADDNIYIYIDSLTLQHQEKL